jgi:hypothetical protein
MKPTQKHLNDEHMRLYEWSGLGAQTAAPLPDRSKRTHAWHASYSVLAVLTSLLILNGCDKQTAAEQASEQVGQAAQEPPEPLYDNTTAPDPADAAAPAAAGTDEPAAANTSEPPAEAGGQAGEAPQQP